MTRAIGNRSGDEICVGVIGAGRVELTYLFGVEQGGYIRKCVAQTSARKEVGKVLKGFVGCLILEGGDEADIVGDQKNGSVGSVGSFNDAGRSVVGIDDAWSHCCESSCREGERFDFQ